jgi:mono/diheme cytochrome c family protein
MNRILYLILTLSVAACAYPKEGAYLVPRDYVVKDRKDFIAQFKIGKLVYAENCERCHNKEIDGKIYEPRFVAAQLESYIIRVKPPAHRGNLPATSLSDDEIKKVILYLYNNGKRAAPKVVRPPMVPPKPM